MKIKELPLILTKRLISTLPEQFSVDQFIMNNKAILGTICNGVDDKNFPLTHSCAGETQLLIFQAVEDIETRPALLSIIKEGFLLTGFKGIASLIKDHAGKIPVENWILSPNRLIEASDKWQTSGIPYLSAGHTDIKYSNHSINYIQSGRYLLLGKQ